MSGAEVDKSGSVNSPTSPSPRVNTRLRSWLLDGLS